MSSAAQQRLRNKLNQSKGLTPLRTSAKRDGKQKLDTIYEHEEYKINNDEEKILHVDTTSNVSYYNSPPIFKVITRKNESLNIDMSGYDFSSSCRVARIKYMVEEKVKSFENYSEDKIKLTLDSIYVTIHPLWIDQHLQSLCIIEESKETPLLTNQHVVRSKIVNSKALTFLNHNIIIIDEKVSYSQMMVDFLGLCWLKDYEEIYGIVDIGRDVIVSLEGWKYYMSMYIGLEFYVLFTNHPFMKPYVEKFKTTVNNLSVLSKEYNEIKYPTREQKNQIREYLYMYPFWSSYSKSLN